MLKKIFAVAVIALLSVILTACAKPQKDAGELALELRAELLEAERIVIDADITADYGDRVYGFTINYTGDGDTGEIHIISPEAVAGITAEVTTDSCVLVYDGARLDTGALTDSGVSPAGTLPVLISQWRSGRIEPGSYERLGDIDTFVFTTSIDDTALQKTWFDCATKMPVRAEISRDGVMVVACEFTGAVIE